MELFAIKPSRSATRTQHGTKCNIHGNTISNQTLTLLDHYNPTIQLDLRHENPTKPLETPLHSNKIIKMNDMDVHACYA